MSLHQMTGLTPHLREVDLDHLRGHTVLGEPLEVLMSAALRLRFEPARHGLVRADAVMTAEEGEALSRAMTRVEAPDTPAQGEQDADRLSVVLTRTCLAADAVIRSLLARPA